MNPAHWHLLFNHLPIVGSMFTLFVLGYGIIFKNNSIIRLSYILFALCAVTSIIASSTGEDAEHYLKGLNNVEDLYLERHVQMAAIANVGMIIIGVVSLMALFFKKIKELKFMPVIIIVLALIVAGLMSYTGKLGGEIMHKEIRIGNSKL